MPEPKTPKTRTLPAHLPLPPVGSKPSYTDVKAGAWYTGWINAAESLGLVQGDGNGLFRPNDTISNQEVITVLMRALGYNDNLTGAWPTNYVTQANKIDMLDDVTIVASAAAKRGDVAVMVSNALDANLVTYDKDTDEFVKKQTTKGGTQNTDISLLKDAFKGTYYEVVDFEAVDSVKDVAKQQLNWNVGIVGYDDNGDPISAGSLIVDKDTRVSVNGGTIFDLDGHQGKVYYVKDNDKYYARFIEVESYTKLVSDQPEQTSNTKVEVKGTKYNAVGNVDFTDLATAGEKNSKYIMYFNDDDQVYAVKSDLDKRDKAYFVESISGSSLKLVGSEGKETMDNDDDEVLIWNGTEFVAPSSLEVGDAVIQIADDLYETAEIKSGVLKSTTSTQWNIDGTNYKAYKRTINVSGKDVDYNGDAIMLDSEMDDADVVIGDVRGNEVQYLLNDDNSISAIIVNEVTNGTKLYGVIVDAEVKDNTSLATNKAKKVTIFTEEGTTVEYTLEDDFKWATDAEGFGTAFVKNDLGKLVEYKLNKDGELTKITAATKELTTNAKGEIEVKNDTYLVGANQNLTLASNVAVFEISEDDGDLDVSLVTRAALLAGGDFEPGAVEDLEYLDGADLAASVTFFTNTNSAARALAYTDASTTNYHFGVIDDVWFSMDDYEDGEALLLVGDENLYEFKNIAKWNSSKVDDDFIIVYTVSGDSITIEKAYDNEATTGYAEVTGTTDGLLTWDVAFESEVDGVDKDITDTMTDSNTVVYTIDKNGDVAEGTVDDIRKGDMIYVPVVDKDGYADIIIVSDFK